ncbi:MAG: Ig-like domain-containing protein [Bacteroidales bacterium]|jgi:glucuronoarabinoxylan endo-1,4-beta-xylanase|nr:Ig-like domain-containing protein [Bacteroidales bacterium]
MKSRNHSLIYILSIIVLSTSNISVDAQTADNNIVSISADESFQTMVGFGGALAFYENWLTSHPKKTQIYEALFDELSLDILRLRNAYDYDATMIDRAKEFVEAAELIRGKPIDVLVTSWGPPGYLKSNGDIKNGGTLKFIKTESGVDFDYAGFAQWWNKSLNEYNSHGISPTYISIQNEPDFTATWESCILRPTEVINANDTLASYSKALDAVYDTIQKRTIVPKFLGPETVGIGYNSVENYINALDINKLYGIGHHLYHGVDVNNPYSSTDFSKVGNFHPEVPHFQTEFSGGDWWSVVGLLYKSLHDESAVSYFYWDLVWPDAGLIDIDNPWSSSNYKRTREFYAFKQFSAYIHPNWTRVAAEIPGDDIKVVAFINPGKDSATAVMINTNQDFGISTAIYFPGYQIDQSEAYLSSTSENCALTNRVNDYIAELPPRSVMTIAMKISETTEILIDSIDLEASNTVIDSRMDSISLSTVIFPETATKKTLLWQLISGNEIATISQNGILKALGTGDGTVKVRAIAIDGSEKLAEIDVELSNQVWVQSIELTTPSDEINILEGSLQLIGTVLPENASNKVLYWELLSGSDIASLSQTGLLKSLGVKDGSVTIQVSTTDGSDISKGLTIAVTNQVSGLKDQHYTSLKAWSYNHTVYFQLPPQETASNIYLFSITGASVISKNIPPKVSSGSIVFPNMTPGLYLLKLTNGNRSSTVLFPVY